MRKTTIKRLLLRKIAVLDGATGTELHKRGMPPGVCPEQWCIDNPAMAADWLKAAETQEGSWWPDLAAWLADRCGADKPAPAELGGGDLRPLAEAPGTYVFDS